mgnify:CR=1 FL=1
MTAVLEPPTEHLTADRPETASSFRFAWRILRADTRTWLISLSMWCLFFVLPLAAGLVLMAVLDRLPPADGSGVWTLVAVLAGLEIGRWLRHARRHDDAGGRLKQISGYTCDKIIIT